MPACIARTASAFCGLAGLISTVLPSVSSAYMAAVVVLTRPSLQQPAQQWPGGPGQPDLLVTSQFVPRPVSGGRTYESGGQLRAAEAERTRRVGHGRLACSTGTARGSAAGI